MRKNFAISNGILILFLLFSYTVFPQSTASPQLSKFQIAAPQLDTIKTIWLYLPKDYSEEKNFRFSICRMPKIYLIMKRPLQANGR